MNQERYFYARLAINREWVNGRPSMIRFIKCRYWSKLGVLLGYSIHDNKKGTILILLQINHYLGTKYVPINKSLVVVIGDVIRTRYCCNHLVETTKR